MLAAFRLPRPTPHPTFRSLMASNTMKRIYSREDILKEEERSTASSIKTDGMASRGGKTRDTLTEALDDAQRLKLFQLLDQWEEPDRPVDDNDVSRMTADLCFNFDVNFFPLPFAHYVAHPVQSSYFGGPSLPECPQLDS